MEQSNLLEFVDKANKRHSNKYDYSQSVYVNSKTKLAIICPVHGIFYQTPNKHLDGRGCPECAKNHAYTTESFIDAAKKVHGADFDYSLVQYVNCNTDVAIKCNHCGEVFWQKPAKHLKGHKCPLCRYSRRDENYLKKYGVSNPMQNEAVKEHFRQSFIAKYGVDNPAKSDYYKAHVAEYTAKARDTRRKNHTFVSSGPEEVVYTTLVGIYGADDVERQYKSMVYPFSCDFYIKSRNLYMELNANWTHGCHWFNGDVVDNAVVKEWQDRRTAYYDNAIETWSVRDVKKRETAIVNDLNYIVFWDNDLDDFNLWVDLGCPDGNDAKQMYSWLQQ